MSLPLARTSSVSRWNQIMSRWGRFARALGLFSQRRKPIRRPQPISSLERLENRDAPSDTLSALLGQLGASQLLANANIDLPTMPQQSFGQPLNAKNLSSENTDFVDATPPSPNANPRPLTQWLDDDVSIAPRDNISLDDGIGSSGSGAGFGFHGSFSAGSSGDAGFSASSSGFSSPITGFSGGSSFGMTANSNLFDGSPQSTTLANSNANSTSSSSAANQNNTNSSAAQTAAANALAASMNGTSTGSSGSGTGQAGARNMFDSGGGGSASPNSGGQQITNPIFVVAPDAGSQPLVKVYDTNLHFQYSFLAFAQSFTGGVRVALADVNGDGTPDIIAGAGPGGGSQVNVFDGRNGHLLYGFNAFDAGVTDGVYVAAGNLNGDGKQEIIVGTDVGSTAPMVKVFDGSNGNFLFSVLVDNGNVHGGLRVAAGDVKGLGHDDIITGVAPSLSTSFTILTALQLT